MLSIEDLKVGHTYSGKSERITVFDGLICDRQILWIGRQWLKNDGDCLAVQYDSPSVGFGKNYPTISAEKFLKWAAEDVTGIMPKGEWRTKC